MPVQYSSVCLVVPDMLIDTFHADVRDAMQLTRSNNMLRTAIFVRTIFHQLLHLERELPVTVPVHLTLVTVPLCLQRSNPAFATIAVKLSTDGRW